MVDKRMINKRKSKEVKRDIRKIKRKKHVVG